VHVEDEITKLIQHYYSCPTIRSRINEFMGGSAEGDATAVYVVGNDGVSGFSQPAAPTAVGEFLLEGSDVERSLWDRMWLLADLDIDYENFDYPVEPYVRPERAITLIQPVLRSSIQVLKQYGISPLQAVSGRGYHLVWAIRRGSQAFKLLSSLGRLPISLVRRYDQPHMPNGETIDLELGRAFAGLGMLLEFVGHQVLLEAGSQSLLPIEITSIEVGPGAYGREMVSFDLSEYGDPLDTRHIRIPFSAYLKPRQLTWCVGDSGVRNILPVFEIPAGSMSLDQSIATMRNPDAIVALSRQVTNRIPDYSDAMEALFGEYSKSELARFHEWFYSVPFQDSDSSVCDNCVKDAEVMAEMPPCVSWPLEQPGDLLLKPAFIQHLARVLYALGWHPCDVAAFIERKFRASPSLRDFWIAEDPANRAIFYTRLFTGLLVTHRDELIDFNCVSHREKGYCIASDCSFNLVAYREAALARRWP
jgi:hypothetical protein